MRHIDVHELELHERTLEAQIHKLERRGIHMTPEDQFRATELKKQRLATKDRLSTMRRG